MTFAKIIVGCLTLCVTLCGVMDAESQVDDPAPLVLQIFEPKVASAEMTQFSFDAKHPLLTIRTLREIHLARDDKGVLLVLTEEDAKTLATLTREFDGRPLIFVAADGVTRLINITSVVDDGRIGFKYPEAAPIAESLRRYFEIGEFGPITIPYRPGHAPTQPSNSG